MDAHQRRRVRSFVPAAVRWALAELERGVPVEQVAVGLLLRRGIGCLMAVRLAAGDRRWGAVRALRRAVSAGLIAVGQIQTTAGAI